MWAEPFFAYLLAYFLPLGGLPAAPALASSRARRSNIPFVVRRFLGVCSEVTLQPAASSLAIALLENRCAVMSRFLRSKSPSPRAQPTRDLDYT